MCKIFFTTLVLLGAGCNKVLASSRQPTQVSNQNFIFTPDIPLIMKKITNKFDITPQQYKESIQNNQIAFIVFYRPNCKYCQSFEPTFLQLQKLYKGRVFFGRINSDYYQEFKEKQGIQTHPCLLIYKDGERLYTVQGKESERSQKNLQALLNTLFI